MIHEYGRKNQMASNWKNALNKALFVSLALLVLYIGFNYNSLICKTILYSSLLLHQIGQYELAEKLFKRMPLSLANTTLSSVSVASLRTCSVEPKIAVNNSWDEAVIKAYGDGSKQIAKRYYHEGEICRTRLYNSQKAIEFYEKSIVYYEHVDSAAKIIKISTMLAMFYAKQGQNDIASLRAQQAMDEIDKMPKSQFIEAKLEYLLVCLDYSIKLINDKSLISRMNRLHQKFSPP